MQGQTWSVDDLFEHRPKLRELYELLRADIEARGEIQVVVTRTQVWFSARRRFAVVWPSPTRGTAPEGTLMLTLELTEPRQSPLVTDIAETFPGKWTHQLPVPDRVTLERIREQGWITAAHGFGTMERARTRRD